MDEDSPIEWCGRHGLDLLCSCCRKPSQSSPSRVRKAVLFIRNAHHGRPPAEPTALSLQARSVYHHAAYRLIYMLVAALHCALAFVEPPGPRRSVFPAWSLLLLEFAALAVYAFDLVIQRLYLGHDLFMQKRWAVAKMALIPVLAINAVIVASVPSGSYVNIVRAVRPVMLIERMRNVRRICGNIINMIPKVTNVGILLAMHNIFFGIMAYVLFAGIDGDNCQAFPDVRRVQQRGAFGRDGPPCSTFLPASCSDYFSSLTESMWQLFVLTTTANFPDVMLPVYSCNPLSAWFFVVYFLIGASFLLNLTLAVALDEFKALTKRKVLDRYDSMFLGFDMGYRELLLEAGAIGGPAHRPRASNPEPKESKRNASRLMSSRVLDDLEKKVDGEIAKEASSSSLSGGSRGRSSAGSGSSGGADQRGVAGEASASASTSTHNPVNGAMGGQQHEPRNPGQNRPPLESVASMGSTLSRSTPRQQLDPGLERDQFVRFFTELRQEASSDFAGLLFDAVDERKERRIFVHQFRRMMLWFAPLSFKEAPKASPRRAGAACGASGADTAGQQQSDLSEQKSATSSSSGVAARPPQLPKQSVRAGASVQEWGPRSPRKAAQVARAGGAAEASSLAGHGHAPQNAASADCKPGMVEKERDSRVRGAAGVLEIGRVDSLHLEGEGQGAQSAASGRQGCFGAVWSRIYRAATSPSYSDTGIGEDAAFGGPLVGYESAVAAVYGTCSLPWFRAVLSQRWVMWFFDFFVLLNGISVVVELGLERDVDAQDSAQQRTLDGLQALQYFTLAIFLFEVTLGLVVWSPLRYWKLSNFNKLDVCLAIGSLGVLIYEASRGDEGQASQVSGGLTFFRMLRLLRALRVLPGFMLMVESLWDITTVIMHYMLVIGAVYYVFIIIGMECFSGALTSENPDVAASAYGQDGFETLTFDSVPEASVVLFYQMVVNNWVIIADGLCAAFQNRWPRLYFSAFYVVTVVIVLNMLLAFIIESFSVQKERRERARQYFGRKALQKLDRLHRLLYKLQRAKDDRSEPATRSLQSQRQVEVLAERLADATTDYYGATSMEPPTVGSTETFPDPESDNWPSIRPRDDEGGLEDDADDGDSTMAIRPARPTALSAPVGGGHGQPQLRRAVSKDDMLRMLRRPSVQPSKVDGSGFIPLRRTQSSATEEAEQLNAAVLAAQEEKTGEEWRVVLSRSGLDFSGWRIWREPRPFDLYDSLFRETIRTKYPQTFGKL